MRCLSVTCDRAEIVAGRVLEAVPVELHAPTVGPGFHWRKMAVGDIAAMRSTCEVEAAAGGDRAAPRRA